MTQHLDTKFQRYLARVEACDEARAWVADRPFWRAWDECERPDWLLWLASKSGADPRRIVLSACRLARTSLRFVPETEIRPRLAIEAAEAWVRTPNKENAYAASAYAYAAANATNAASAYAYAASAYAYAANATNAAYAYAASAYAYAAADATNAAADAYAAANATNADADAAADATNAASAYAYAAANATNAAADAYAAADATNAASAAHAVADAVRREQCEIVRRAIPRRRGRK